MFMTYVPRKIVYPIFTFAVILILLAVILFSFGVFQSLEVIDPQVSVIGDKVSISLTVKNVSNHVVHSPTVTIKTDTLEVSENLPDLVSGEEFLFVKNIDFSESLLYNIYVSAPYTMSVHIPFEIDESTIRPVEAEVYLTSNMQVGNEYSVEVKLCNKSNDYLPEVFWITSVQGNYFKEEFFPRTFSLKGAPNPECKNFYSTFTPINPGIAKVTFTLKVGSLEQTLDKEITISPK